MFFLKKFLAGKALHLIGAGAIVAFLAYTHFQAYRNGVAAERNRNTAQVVKIVEDLNEIRNHRPDDRALVDRLRKGTF